MLNRLARLKPEVSNNARESVVKHNWRVWLEGGANVPRKLFEKLVTMTSYPVEKYTVSCNVCGEKFRRNKTENLWEEE